MTGSGIKILEVSAIILLPLISPTPTSIEICPDIFFIFTLPTPKFIAICIIFGTVVACTLYILEAIRDLRKDLNRDKDINN